MIALSRLIYMDFWIFHKYVVYIHKKSISLLRRFSVIKILFSLKHLQSQRAIQDLVSRTLNKHFFDQLQL